MPGDDNDYAITIDSDADTGSWAGLNELVVQKFSTHAKLYSVDETGTFKLWSASAATCGAIHKATPILFNNTSGTGDIVQFQYGGTRVASIAGNGMGVFDVDGVRLHVDGGEPNGVRPGPKGNLILSHISGVWKLQACTDASTKEWRYLTFSAFP